MVRVLLGGDLHKLPKDKTTIEGYVDCTQAVQCSLVNTIKEHKIDYFISLGDWYDKGYGGDTAACHADVDADIEMAKVLNGKFYGLIGNHIRLGMDSNPELMLIQPHPQYVSRRRVTRAEQIIKTPDILRIGDVQISFMHHNKDATDCTAYKAERQAWAKYHIGLYHTLYVIPNAQLSKTDYGYNVSSNSKIAETLKGVDLAIVGDCHTPLGQFTVNAGDHMTIMIVPGSLTNTDASETRRHTYVMLPLITIDDESHVTLAYEKFDLKTNMLTFKKKNVEKSLEKLKTLGGKPVQKLHEEDGGYVKAASEPNVFYSLNAFMAAQSYSTVDKALVRAVLDEPDRIDKMISIYKAGQEDIVV